MGHLYALDFDGVLCDTCGETAISAVKVHALSSSLSLKIIEEKYTQYFQHFHCIYVLLVLGFLSSFTNVSNFLLMLSS